MNRDDIIRMAREDRAAAQKIFDAIRDGTADFDDFFYGFLDNLRNVEFDDGYKVGAADERKACANLCREPEIEKRHIDCGKKGCAVAHYHETERPKTARECAAAIRARGQG